MRQLIEGDQNGDPAHEPAHHRVGNELDQRAQAQCPERELDHPGRRDAGTRQGHGLPDAERRVGGERGDEGGEDEAGGGARSRRRKRRAGKGCCGDAAEDRGGKPGANADLRMLGPERRVCEDAECQRVDEAGDRAGEAPGKLAAKVRGATARLHFPVGRGRLVHVRLRASRWRGDGTPGCAGCRRSDPRLL
jgi:hypothetical protein